MNPHFLVRPEWLFETVSKFQAAAIMELDGPSERPLEALRSTIPAPRSHVEELLLKGLIALAQLGMHRMALLSHDELSGLDPIVDRAAALVARRYREPLTYVRIGRELGRDPEYLESLFRARFGESLHTYLRRVRIGAAVKAIQQGEKIEAVALQVGFRTKSGFLRAFRAITGTTPARFRS